MDASRAYATLEVGSDATFSEIRAAYRRLALELHPDRGSDNDGERFRLINEAYNVLKQSTDSGKRSPVKPGRRTSRQWGPPPGAKAPEQDWSRHTKEFEDENPDFWKEYEKKFWQQYNSTINADGRNGEYAKAAEPKARPNLSVQVDPSLCIACQSCETIAPDVFHINADSGMNPKSTVINQRGAGFNKIMNAAETCPTKAIIVEDKDKRARLYPL